MERSSIKSWIRSFFVEPIKISKLKSFTFNRGKDYFSDKVGCFFECPMESGRTAILKLEEESYWYSHDDGSNFVFSLVRYLKE